MQRRTPLRVTRLAAFAAVAAFSLPALATTAGSGSGAGSMPSQRIINESPSTGVAGTNGSHNQNQAGDLSSGSSANANPTGSGTLTTNNVGRHGGANANGSARH